MGPDSQEEDNMSEAQKTAMEFMEALGQGDKEAAAAKAIERDLNKMFFEDKVAPQKTRKFFSSVFSSEQTLTQWLERWKMFSPKPLNDPVKGTEGDIYLWFTCKICDKKKKENKKCEGTQESPPPSDLCVKVLLFSRRQQPGQQIRYMSVLEPTADEAQQC
mmetsp:Transcript_121898/g.356254  ORF Transcript_121898/g.356254 Transcript_121898/m.356254 type:complete len:161 (+) Transcript_121898:167-649(+)